MVFKYDKTIRVSDAVPQTFKMLASNFREVVNYYGTGIAYVFDDKIGPHTVINVLLSNATEDAMEELLIMIEVENKFISTERSLTPLELHQFCMSYATAYSEKLGGVGPG